MRFHMRKIKKWKPQWWQLWICSCFSRICKDTKACLTVDCYSITSLHCMLLHVHTAHGFHCVGGHTKQNGERQRRVDSCLVIIWVVIIPPVLHHSWVPKQCRQILKSFYQCSNADLTDFLFVCLFGSSLLILQFCSNPTSLLSILTPRW